MIFKLCPLAHFSMNGVENRNMLSIILDSFTVNTFNTNRVQ